VGFRSISRILAAAKALSELLAIRPPPLHEVPGQGILRTLIPLTTPFTLGDESATFFDRFSPNSPHHGTACFHGAALPVLSNRPTDILNSLARKAA